MARAQRFLVPPQMLTKPGDACHRCPLMGQVQESFSNVAIFQVVGFGCCERWRCVRECRKGRSKGSCSDPPNCCQHGQQGMCLGTSYPKAIANLVVAIYSPRSFTRWSTDHAQALIKTMCRRWSNKSTPGKADRLIMPSADQDYVQALVEQVHYQAGLSGWSSVSADHDYAQLLVTH